MSTQPARVLVSVDLPQELPAGSSSFQAIDRLAPLLARYRLPVTWGAHRWTADLAQRCVRPGDELAIQAATGGLGKGRLRMVRELGRQMLELEEAQLSCSTLLLPMAAPVFYDVLAEFHLTAVRTPVSRAHRFEPLRAGVWTTAPTVCWPQPTWLRRWAAARQWRRAVRRSAVVHLLIDLDDRQTARTLGPVASQLQAIGRLVERGQLRPTTPARVARELQAESGSAPAARSILRRAA